MYYAIVEIFYSTIEGTRMAELARRIFRKYVQKARWKELTSSVQLTIKHWKHRLLCFPMWCLEKYSQQRGHFENVKQCERRRKAWNFYTTEVEMFEHAEIIHETSSPRVVPEIMIFIFYRVVNSAGWAGWNIQNGAN